ncbi:MAG: hypothetical protein NT007_00565 [Candidatus Kapabacteria bacterium]|nr:hypothetical protein [Candidatus Kapabacteria bacterium]
MKRIWFIISVILFLCNIALIYYLINSNEELKKSEQKCFELVNYDSLSLLKEKEYFQSNNFLGKPFSELFNYFNSKYKLCFKRVVSSENYKKMHLVFIDNPKNFYYLDCWVNYSDKNKNIDSLTNFKPFYQDQIQFYFVEKSRLINTLNEGFNMINLLYHKKTKSFDFLFNVLTFYSSYYDSLCKISNEKELHKVIEIYKSKYPESYRGYENGYIR